MKNIFKWIYRKFIPEKFEGIIPKIMYGKSIPEMQWNININKKPAEIIDFLKTKIKREEV